jgi:hypothetical protein
MSVFRKKKTNSEISEIFEKDLIKYGYKIIDLGYERSGNIIRAKSEDGFSVVDVDYNQDAGGGHSSPFLMKKKFLTTGIKNEIEVLEKINYLNSQNGYFQWCCDTSAGHIIVSTYSEILEEFIFGALSMINQEFAISKSALESEGVDFIQEN